MGTGNVGASVVVSVVGKGGSVVGGKEASVLASVVGGDGVSVVGGDGGSVVASVVGGDGASVVDAC